MEINHTKEAIDFGSTKANVYVGDTMNIHVIHCIV